MISERSVVANGSGPSPRCRSQIEGMKILAPSLQLRNYVVIATNPGGWQSLYLSVRAISRSCARDGARRELARTKRDDWSVDLAVEAEAHERAAGDAYDRTG